MQYKILLLVRHNTVSSGCPGTSKHGKAEALGTISRAILGEVCRLSTKSVEAAKPDESIISYFQLEISANRATLQVEGLTRGKPGLNTRTSYSDLSGI